MTDIVIVSAARTPVGAFNGALSSVPAPELGQVAIAEALRRAKVDAKEVTEVILGQILTAGAGQNPARQAAVAAGIPVEKTAYGINQLCGSGLRAVALGYPGDPQRRQRDRRRRRPGEHEPGAALHASAQRRQDGRRRAGRHHDQGRAVGRLQRLSHGQHGRERRAEDGRSRASSRTQFAAASQQKAEAAQKAGRFKDEIVAGHDHEPQGRRDRRCRRISEARHDRRSRWPSCGRPSTRTAR